MNVCQSRDEISLVLYLESVAVDNKGVVNTERMNDIDMANAKAWKESGFISFSRIPFAEVKRPCETYRIGLSDEAWAEAHKQRRARAERTHPRRTGGR
jgi:hypothetical protein